MHILATQPEALMFMGLDLSASSAITQKKLKWKPTGPGLIADLDEMDYAQKI